MFSIVLKDNKDFVLCVSPTRKVAEKRLKDMIKTDKKLAKFYGWKKIPEYEIIEEVLEVKQ